MTGPRDHLPGSRAAPIGQCMKKFFTDGNTNTPDRVGGKMSDVCTGERPRGRPKGPGALGRGES